MSSSSTTNKIIVVANRLPIKAVRGDNNNWSFNTSSGGLVSALQGVKGKNILTIGWIGETISNEIDQQIITKELAERDCIPVFIDEETMDRYYNKFSNGILWPLLHDKIMSHELRDEKTYNYRSLFKSYEKANEMFAEVVLKQYKDGDVVWCHDYQLFCLPKLLKEKNNSMKVMWFLHTSFPHLSRVCQLPRISHLLRSILASDVVGFQTLEDANNFVSASTQICKLNKTPEGVTDHGKLTKVHVFPIGIDANRFISALDFPKVQRKIEEFKACFKDRKVIIAVDRLDIAKGIPEKILAFKIFLIENPIWEERVILMQIAVPSRQDVQQYKEYTSDVREVVAGFYDGENFFIDSPLHYVEGTLEFHELCALYSLADVALVTSWRDGMNLVSYEFVACQASRKGVLILSEFAGAAKYLRGAITVNPADRHQTVLAIGKALDMLPGEREQRHALNFKHVTEHTAQVWAENCLSGWALEAQLRMKQVHLSKK